MGDKEYELLQLRAEDFARNFHSLREIEWHTTYQAFAGYAAIVLAVEHIPLPNQNLMRILGVAATLILLICTLYLSRRIQERLHFTRIMQNAYFKKLHTALDVPELPLPAKTPGLIDSRNYAFAVQTILNCTVAVFIVVYMLVSLAGSS